jgi:hypothetical protein
VLAPGDAWSSGDREEITSGEREDARDLGEAEIAADEQAESAERQIDDWWGRVARHEERPFRTDDVRFPIGDGEAARCD